MMATILIVMGVSGCGKSTVGKELAERLKVDFLDGDDLHSSQNISKMKSGSPLGDEDRIPWLLRIREKAVGMLQAPGLPSSTEPIANPARMVITACSALKRAYRDILRGEQDPQGRMPSTIEINQDQIRTCLIYLKGSKELIERRMQQRRHHFMGAEMLESQLRTLEEPDVELEDSSHSLTLTVYLESQGVEHAEKALPDIVQDIIVQLNSKGVALPSAAAQTTSSSLPPVELIIGPKADLKKTKETLEVLLEVSESIDRCLIPLLHQTQQPIQTYDELILLCQEIVQRRFDLEDQVNFLGSHPRIGEVKGLSKMSSREQKNHQPTDPHVLRELERLNQVYETVYPGLRYVTFVNGRERAEIVQEMRAKLYGTDDTTSIPEQHIRDEAWFAELARGTGDVFKIAQSRLKLLNKSSR